MIIIVDTQQSVQGAILPHRAMNFYVKVNRWLEDKRCVFIVRWLEANIAALTRRSAFMQSNGFILLKVYG